MQYTGNINKMRTELVEGSAHYTLPIGDDKIFMNNLLGKKLTLEFTGAINCLNCNVVTKKSYSQGYCYMCMQSLACCDLCILKPETCHHHLGTCREPDWGLEHCFAPHVVYLANSSGVKVGITRMVNIPSRFIDQGAVEFLPILEVSSRIESGKIEAQIKQFVADKTNWRAMLKNQINSSNLVQKKEEVLAKIPEIVNDLTKATILDHKPQQIQYPVLEYPDKVVSLSFDKTPIIEGLLKGIKGQYLILDTGVLNIRKFSAYHLRLSY